MPVFAGLVNNAKAAASRLVLRYVARASVAIPFLIAIGFAIAALAVMLVERFGHVTAYWIMAGGLAAIGVIAAIVVSVKEHEEDTAEKVAEQHDTKGVIGDGTSDAMMQAPVALLGALVTAPGGITTVLKIARVLGRNYPLVLLLVMIGALFYPSVQHDEGDVRPDAMHPPSPLH